jgi:aerobic carbon-monoxide dehydrogenase medium subunit
MARTYFQPASLDDALAVLAEHPEGDLVAGGTDLVVGARQGKRGLGETLIAIHGLDELRGLEQIDGGLRLGGLVTHWEIEHDESIRARFTALSDGSALVGSPATRHTATIGGNLANASPAADTASPLLVFEASVELASAARRRTLPLADFFTGPGATSRAGDELVTCVEIPPLPAGRVGSAYVRLEYRRAMEIAVAGAAVLVSLDDADRIVEGRIALTAVAPVCLRVPAAERLLVDERASPEILDRAAEAASAAARPIDDVRASAEYRGAMVPVIVRRALDRALARAREEDE